MQSNYQASPFDSIARLRQQPLRRYALSEAEARFDFVDNNESEDNSQSQHRRELDQAMERTIQRH
jgi:hypothetical protein